MHLMHNFYIFVTALFSSLIMVPVIRKWAIDTGAVDFPGERRAHNRIIARAGGIAIFIPFIFSVLVYLNVTQEVRGILAGALLIFFTGLADDMYQLTAKQKLIGQVSGCSVAILVGHLYLTDLGNLIGMGDIVLPLWAGGLLSLLALVGVINAINLIDGLDGLAGGLSAVSLLAFIWLALQEQDLSALALSVALLGSLLGFLKYNAFPARIFMGDTGSLVVGFLLGSLSIMLTQGEGGKVNAVIPLMILSVPIGDTLVVMIRRALRGDKVYSADRSHLHHKIMDLGLDHSITVLLIHLFAFFWAVVALVFRDQPEFLLFGGLFAGTITMHLMVNMLTSSKREKGGRVTQEIETGITGKGRLWSTIVNIVVTIGIAAILALNALVSVFASMDGEKIIPLLVALGVGVFGLSLFLWKGRQVNLFCFLSLAPILVINYLIEDRPAISGVENGIGATLVNIAFVVLAVMVLYKIVRLDRVDSVLDFFFVFMLFALSLSLAIVPAALDLDYHVSGVVSKSIVSVLSFKLLIREKENYGLFIAYILNAAVVVSLFIAL